MDSLTYSTFSPETTILDGLKRDIAAWESLGHPMIFERFMVRKGTLFLPDDVRYLPEGERGEAGYCYTNSAVMMDDYGADYCEGLATSLGFSLNHAWLVRDGKAIDVTWAPDLKSGAKRRSEYLGVVLTPDELDEARDEMGGESVFLSPEGFYNMRLIYALDPELREIVEKIERGERVRQPATSP